MTNPIIYGIRLAEPDSPIRYVGKTTRTARQRFAEHLKASTPTATAAVHRWIAQQAAGAVEMVILESLAQGATNQEVEFAENKWIRVYTWGTADTPRTQQGLLNHTRSHRFARAVALTKAFPPTARPEPAQW